MIKQLIELQKGDLVSTPEGVVEVVSLSVDLNTKRVVVYTKSGGFYGQKDDQVEIILN